jgi:cytochrome P450
MTQYPEIQAKAQEEINHIVGPDRLPTAEDRPNLPYVEALMNEVLRFSSILPQGVPHKVRESDIFHGYAIPEGTIIMPNIWYVRYTI